MSRPRIVVTLDTSEMKRRGVPIPIVRIKTSYVRAVEIAGGLPILAAPTADAEVIAGLAGLMDGLVISGGGFDIEPERYGAVPSGGKLNAPKPERTSFEAALLDFALTRGVAILGICGGMQLLNVVLGGTLVQDILTEIPGAIDHEQPNPPSEAHHGVELAPSSPLAARLGSTKIRVNSTHHQAVASVAPDLVATGWSEDGVIEAVAHRSAPGVVGVQWHPEQLADEVSRVLYGDLVARARRS